MSITHEEARRLIQFKADNALHGGDTHQLDDHLRDCPDCREYASSISRLESALRPLLQRRWAHSPLPLHAAMAVSSRRSKLTQNIFFATRIIAMGVICVAFLFNIWHFTQSGPQGSSPSSAEIPQIPTPSMPSATTAAPDQNCTPFRHTVRRTDTLAGIAKQYSIPVEEIIQANHLKTEALIPSMELSIPRCSPTPSGTPGTTTTAFTPLLESTTLTPAHSPTQ